MLSVLIAVAWLAVVLFRDVMLDSVVPTRVVRADSDVACPDVVVFKLVMFDSAVVVRVVSDVSAVAWLDDVPCRVVMLLSEVVARVPSEVMADVCVASVFWSATMALPLADMLEFRDD